MTSINKTLRVGAGERSTREVASAASKPKAKKGSFVDRDYHGFFNLNGHFCRFSTYGGRRYVEAQDIVDEKFLTTISGG